MVQVRMTVCSPMSAVRVRTACFWKAVSLGLHLATCLPSVFYAFVLAMPLVPQKGRKEYCRQARASDGVATTTAGLVNSHISGKSGFFLQIALK